MASKTDDLTHTRRAQLLVPPNDNPCPHTSEDGSLLNPALVYLRSLNSPRSVQTMASLLAIGARILGATSVETCCWGSLRRHHVLGIVEVLQETNLTKSTINNYLSALKGVAREAYKLKLMDYESHLSIMELGNFQGREAPRGRTLQRDEIHRLFAVCEADRSSSGPRDAAILSVILGCGLCRSEVVGLNLNDVAINEMALRVRGKGQKERMVYMPLGTMQRLILWVDLMSGEDSGPLFIRIRRFDRLTDARLTDQAVYHILQVRQSEAGIEKCVPQDLRRTFATVMLEAGEDLIKVTNAMGHASITTTMQYARNR